MIWSAGACAVCLLVCLPLYFHYRNPLHMHLACSFKSLGTLCACMMAVTAALKLDPRCWACAAALLLYAVADYVLEFSFMYGAGFFLAGHICNIAFFLNLAPVSVLHLLSLLFLGGLGLFVLYNWRRPIEKQMKFFVIYGISLLLMVVCAIGCFSLNSTLGILIACGGALFYVSDLFILRRLLFPSGKLLSWFIMITYYFAVLLFGMACLFI